VVLVHYAVGKHIDLRLGHSCFSYVIRSLNIEKENKEREKEKNAAASTFSPAGAQPVSEAENGRNVFQL
jgi:hypothetical protein